MSVTGNGSNGHHYFTLNINEKSTNIENNTSTVEFSFVLGPIQNTWNWNSWGTKIYYSVNINGNVYDGYIPEYDGYATVTIRTGNLTVPHNTDGTKSISVSFSVTDSTGQKYTCGNASASGTLKLSDIPRYSVISTASNFNDEQNPKITFTNPSKYFALKAKIEAGGNSALITRSLDKTATSCTFSLTEAERDKLRALCTTSNSLAVRFTICCMSGSTELSASYLDRTMTIVNGNPTFSTYTYKDTNSKVTNLLGSDQLLVKGLSNLQITILATNKMITKKKATAKNYVVTVDNINKSINYSTSDIVQLIGTLKTSGTKRLTVRAYDSRNNSVAVNKDIFVYEYEKPVINATVNRLNNFENQTTLSVKGSFSKLVVDNVEKNAITSLQYRYREHNGTWNEWTDLEGTLTDNKFECKDVIFSLDNTKAFEFEVKVVDNLSESNSTLSVDIGQAIFFISSNQKKCFVNGNEVLGFHVIREIPD